jgi:hypothetical protein
MIAGAKATVYADVNSPERPAAVVRVPTVDGLLEMRLTWTEARSTVEWGLHRLNADIFADMFRAKREPWQESAENAPTMTVTEVLTSLLPIAQRWGRDQVPAITALIFWLQAELHAPGGIT